MNEALKNDSNQLSPIEEWRADFEKQPVKALDNLLTGHAYMGKLNRNEIPEILFRLFHAELPEVQNALDKTMLGWFEKNWGIAHPSIPAVRWAEILQSAFQAVDRLDLCETYGWLLGKHSSGRLWLRSFYLDPSRDPEAAFLRTLALRQKNQDLLPVWMRLCRMEEGLPLHYASIGLLGLRKLPEKNGELPGDLHSALFSGIINLANAIAKQSKDVKNGESFWSLELRAIMALYPRSMRYWVDRFLPLIYQEPHCVAAEWLGKMIPKLKQEMETTASAANSARNIVQPLSPYRTLFETGKSLVAETEIGKLLPLVIDKVIEQTKAQRGMIVISGDDGELVIETARDLDKKDVEQPEFQVSKTIIQSVLQTGQFAVIKNALEDSQFKESASVSRLHLLSVACAPLRVENEILGVIYIDNRNVEGLFDNDTGKLLSEFAELISVAVRNTFERRRLIERQRKLRAELDESLGYGKIIGRSPAMLETFKLIDKIADTNATVLITGETGTGKALIARVLHQKSLRRDHELVHLNCSALPENLLESELFGYEKEAFTGANRRKPGWFEVANHGTIFFDEIDQISPSVQVKLLRFMQSGEFSPVGALFSRQVDVRIIAATSCDLAALVEQDKFLEGLFYRLKVIELKSPPLRQRGDDILLLAKYFLLHFARHFNKPVTDFSQEALDLLLDYDFPGNVRELENIIQRAVVLAEGQTIQLDDLPLSLHEMLHLSAAETEELTFNFAKQKWERDFLRERLKQTNGNIAEAARRAGMHSKNFIQKMKQYGIRREDFI